MEFSGHEIRSVSQLGTAPGSEEMDNRLPFPRLINGKFEFTTLVQQFARSASVLSQGMCGGPAFVESGDANKPFVYGIVDGIIPMDHPDERLRGLVSVLPSADIEA